MIKKEQSSVNNKRLIKQKYELLDSVQFKPDYMCLIIDRESDYHRACKGFSINGISYKRLLGTNGGIKNSTIVFVSERLWPELSRRIENGRRTDKAIVPAKLESYKALSCSASVPVSMPNGILVVHDVSTTYRADTIYLNDECDGEPIMEERPNTEITMDASDGCGMMLPSLAERWSKDLGLDYVMSGANTRFSFEKGMVFTFDFVEFADKVAHSYLVEDVWGNMIDIRNVELIMTDSMVKLWEFYSSVDDYVGHCMENGYTFGVPKVCPEFLENERSLNYQFIQSYDLDDDDIDELISPTMNEIKDVLGGDWRKTILFMRGSGLNDNNVDSGDADYAKAIMANPNMVNDPFIRHNIFQLIRNRINEAKVGVLKVHGNYSILCGDLYALCQSMFGMEVTGLLKAGEIYNEYWDKSGADSLAAYRAPMTCHNNIRLVRPCRTDDARYWFRYIHTGTIFNSWDAAGAAMNGADFDGDLAMLTDNDVLVRKLVVSPAIMCVQRRANKKVPTEQDFIDSNIASFGNEIGQTTNWITSMFEVQARFDKNSKEYETLAYRIKCGQLIQQNVIDKTKGIVAKPMPRYWHDKHAVNTIEDDEERRFQRSIVANVKPYFMIYIYPALMRQYNTYIKNTNRNALREFGITVDEMSCVPYSELTERQRDFLYYYNARMPVGVGNCVMNKICRRFEDEFDGYLGRHSDKSSFDYSIMKSGNEYTQSQYKAICKLYDRYTKNMQNYVMFTYYEGIDDDESSAAVDGMRVEFEKECYSVCQNEETLCDIILDVCYKRNSTKKFAWDMCGKTIIANLVNRNGGMLAYPALDENGDIEYCGERFIVKFKVLGEDGYGDCA